MVSLLDVLPQIVSGSAALGMAATLAILNRGSRPARLFAVLLGLRGAATLTYTVGVVAPSAAAAETLWHIFPVLYLPVTFAALGFVAIYPKPRGVFDRLRHPEVPFLAGAAAVVLAYVVQPTLFWDLAAAAGHPLGPGVGAPTGPLFVFDTLFLPVFAGAAFLFLRDALRDPSRSRRTSLALIGAGFATFVVFSTVLLVAFIPDTIWRHGGLLTAAAAANVLGALAITVGLAGHLARVAWDPPDDHARRLAVRVLAVLPWPAVSVLALGLAPSGGLEARYAPLYLFAGIWRLALPGLATYALLRHHLFDIDLTVRSTVERTTLVAVFLAVFFVASEGVELVIEVGAGTVVPAPWPTVVGVGAAVLLSFALRPLERFSERVASWAMPGLKRVERMDDDERQEVFREQVHIALSDRTLTTKEREMLDKLQDRLGIDPEQADRIEGEVRARYTDGTTS